MGAINILDEQLANQIAAGEVVERPASVVKELVENAVDAGSTTIDVTIEEGGLTLVRVKDNGPGIFPEDMPLAFQRHATSKIAASGDLFRISSLGFRGEALPSIAAVSRLECRSASDNSGLGQLLRLEGGHVRTSEPISIPQGTEVVVRDLFYNTPARLKYMKSIQTETGHISDYVNRMALAHPGISFTLSHNGNALLRTLGTGDRLQVIAAIYGTATAKAMTSFEAESADYVLGGYTSLPQINRSNRNGITVIVNGRYIRSYSVNQALLQAYHTLLPINRFPLTVIEIGMHPSLLDVNVHPSKMEVRFSKETELKQLIEETIRKVLHNERYTPGVDTGVRPKREGALVVQDEISFHRTPPVEPDDWMRDVPKRADQIKQGAVEDSSYGKGREAGSSHAAQPPQQGRDIPPDAAQKLYATPSTRPVLPDVARERLESWRKSQTGMDATEGAGTVDAEAISETAVAEATTEPIMQSEADPAPQPAVSTETEANQGAPFPVLHWIGQHHGTYIIAQAEDGLYLIDQHAAHERVHYEYYLKKFGQPAKAGLQLLVPFTLELTPGDALQLSDRLSLLAEVGVVLEPFGAQTFLVREHPAWMPSGDELALIEEMIELLLTERKAISIEKLREKAAIMCSCKASIKANQSLTRESGEMLLDRLSRCKQPFTCPHGRPIVVHLSTYQLEKMFKRVM